MPSKPQQAYLLLQCGEIVCEGVFALSFQELGAKLQRKCEDRHSFGPETCR